MKKRIQIQGFLIFVSFVLTVVFMFVLQKFIFIQWQKEGGDEILDAIGIALICLGYFIRMTARGYKSQCVAHGRNLVVDGIYRHVRNPMYLGSFIIGVGIVVVLFQLWLIVVVMLAFGLIYEPQTRREEEFLLRNFGQEYNGYKFRTPKYFPLRTPAFLKSLFESSSLYGPAIKNEFPSFLAIFFVITTLAAWQDARLFGGHEFLVEFVEFILMFSGVIMGIVAINKMFVRKVAASI